MEIKGKFYKLSADLNLQNGRIPLTYWRIAPNFGDLLSPWLITRLTGLPVQPVNLPSGHPAKLSFLKWVKPRRSYFAIGSIIERINKNSIVWGSGAFGTERAAHVAQNARIHSVRGPLTRNIVRLHGLECPEIYGDPALIIPYVYNPVITKRYKVGIITRWSEQVFSGGNFSPDIKYINFSTNSIEKTINSILACDRIISSSLHGLIIADAYGIPTAWLASDSPKGLAFKYYDYFLSVCKIQKPQTMNVYKKSLSFDDIYMHIEFNHEAIEFDVHNLLGSCPFLVPVANTKATSGAER